MALERIERRRPAWDRDAIAKLDDGTWAFYSDRTGWIGGLASKKDAEFMLSLINCTVEWALETQREGYRTD